ncbi:MAG: hypothetical protein QNJ32_15395 [Xenococcaceae cyanobacterium MO_167.B27]|nr:hypothetical protein [Xenococcaceae cyanobacterium MO_167.B27]
MTGIGRCRRQQLRWSPVGDSLGYAIADAFHAVYYEPTTKKGRYDSKRNK